ncbi:putative uncharacterized protein FLJ43944 [Dasypus novemcinctus]|uniref:putative uncharacterized protein FLJ43944 n=1 Tax=Dasypus novemcinctus TaxID=9361 RepID=UPI00265E5C60|nr:leucine-rich repeat-containing protein 37A-like [Dasypus novemcinctus]
MTVYPPGLHQPQHVNLPHVTVKPVDLILTTTPEPTTEVVSPMAQQEAPAQPPEPPKESEPSPVQQVAPGYPPEPPETVEPPTVQQVTPAQSPVPLKEGEFLPAKQEAQTSPLEPTKEEEPFPNQQESQAQLPTPPKQVEPSPTQQESSVYAPEPTEVESSPAQVETPTQPPEPHEVEMLPPGHIQAQHPVFSNVTVKPVDLQLTITPAQSPEPPEEFEPSPVQQVVPAQSLELPKEMAPSPTQQVPQESQDHSPEPQKDQVVTLQPPGQDEAQHSNLPSVTLKPVDLQVTITPEPIEEGGPSPVQHVTPPVPPELTEVENLPQPSRSLYLCLQKCPQRLDLLQSSRSLQFSFQSLLHTV